MNLHSKNRFIHIGIKMILGSVLLILGLGKIYFSKDKIITGDGRFYFAQVRSVLFDYDLDFENDLEMYDPFNKNSKTLRKNVKTGMVENKYPIGSALLWSPFILLAKLISSDHTGYGYIYQFMLLLASICYFMASTILIQKWLNQALKVDIAYVYIFLYTSATTAFYYSFAEPSMSHIPSLFTVSLYLYVSSKFFGKHKKLRASLLIGFAAALMILTRNQNALFLIFSLADFVHSFDRNRRNSIQWAFLSAGICILFLVPQFYYWKIIYGEYLLYSYKGESFKYLNSPKFAEVLFSRVSGLIYWHPIHLISVIGLITILFKKINLLNVLIFLSFILQLYIFSSWECWWLGDSFGYRGLANCIPLLAYGFFAFWYALNNSLNIQLIFGILIVAVFFNLILSLLYAAGLIPHNEPFYYSDLLTAFVELFRKINLIQ